MANDPHQSSTWQGTLGLSSGVVALGAALTGTLLPGVRLVAVLLICLAVAGGVAAHVSLNRWAPSNLLVGALVAVSATFGGLLFAGYLSTRSPWTVLLLPLYPLLALGATGLVRTPRLSPRALGMWFCALTFLLMALTILVDVPRIDVHVFLTEGSRALLHGQNPFAISYTNVYDARESALLYGPGIVVDGRVSYGFPYPPTTLLAAVPGYLAGDVRLSVALAVCALVAALLWRSTAPAPRAAALLLVCSPGAAHVVPNSWVEPLMVALLGFTVLALHRGRLLLAACVLGLLLVSKQYFVVLAPCLWLLRPYATRGRVLAMVASAAATVVPFLLWDPAAFYRSIVEFQFLQPYRPDSVGLLVWTVEHLGWPGPSVYGVLPLAAGLLTSVLLAVRLRPGPDAFSVAVAAALVVTVMLSKQAFLNYYYLAAGALFVAAWSRLESGRPGRRPAPVPEQRYAARSR